MTIEARIPFNIIQEARKGVAERKSAEKARVRASQVLEDLRKVFDISLARNNNQPTEILPGGWKAMDLHVKDHEIDEEAHVRLVDLNYGINVSVDGLPVSIMVTRERIGVYTNQKVPRTRSYSDTMDIPMGWSSPEESPLEAREPSGIEVTYLEKFIEGLEDSERTRICPEDPK